MKVLLLSSSYNSLTQRVQAELDDLGYKTEVALTWRAGSKSSIYHIARWNFVRKIMPAKNLLKTPDIPSESKRNGAAHILC